MPSSRNIRQANRHLRPATTYPAIVGQVLRQSREQHGFNQADLAGAAGVTQATWSKIERGQSALTVEQLAAATRFLQTTPGQVLNRADAVVAEANARGVRVEPERLDALGAGLILIGAAALGALIAAALIGDED